MACLILANQPALLHVDVFKIINSRATAVLLLTHSKLRYMCTSYFYVRWAGRWIFCTITPVIPRLTLSGTWVWGRGMIQIGLRVRVGLRHPFQMPNAGRSCRGYFESQKIYINIVYSRLSCRCSYMDQREI